MRKFGWKKISIMMICILALSFLPFIHVSAETENTGDEFSVINIWKDSWSAAGTVGTASDTAETIGNRPSYVDVQLTADGVVYDTVRLSAENNWSYTWKGLSSAYKWEVVEKSVPEGYSVTSELQDGTFVITNTEIVEDGVSAVSEDTNTEDNGTGDAEKLPRTALIKGPLIPVLASSGLLLFIIGWSIYRKHSNGDDTDEKEE
jgi:hypothetical protein